MIFFVSDQVDILIVFQLIQLDRAGILQVGLLLSNRNLELKLRGNKKYKLVKKLGIFCLIWIF